MRLKITLLIFSLFLLSKKGVPQDRAVIDSLWGHTKGVDTSAVSTYFKLATEYYHWNPDSAIVVCELAKELSEKINYKRGQGESYAWLGYLLENKGEVDQALAYDKKGLSVRLQIHDTSGIGNSYNNIGYIFEHLGGKR